MFFRKFRPISISLSPNTERDDVCLTTKLLFQPWRWKAKNPKLENNFKTYLGVNFAYSFNSGRSCLMAILHALEIQEGNEIMIQAFTCNAVPNPIIWSRANPVYVDIDETLNIDPDDLEKKITPRSKAIIVQHTFGQPARMDRILEIARSHNLYLIEDCAHTLGAQHDGKLVGTIGDIAFFSFGRDKVVSSVWGGMVVTNNIGLAKKIEEFQQKLPYPSKFWVFQQFLHPILMNLFILPFYNFGGAGKFLLVVFQKLNLLSRAVTAKEKIGEKPSYFPARLPNALAVLVAHQFKKLERFNEHRSKIAEFYKSNLPHDTALHANTGNVYWRYPVLIKDSEEIIKKSRKSGILFDDGWRGSPIVPHGTNLEKMRYHLGSCPNAEKISKHILSLPTHINITEKEAQRIIDFLKIHGN